MKRSAKVANSSNFASPKLELPTWACRQIRELSRRTGIAQERIRDMVLGFGLYRAKTELAQVCQLVLSASKLATLDPQDEEWTKDDFESPTKTVQHFADSTGEKEQEGPAQPDLYAPLRTGEPGDAGVPPDDSRSDNAIERRDESGESGTSNDLLAALTGE